MKKRLHMTTGRCVAGGMTRTDVVIVVALVVVITGLAFPLIARMRSNDARRVCANNLMSMGGAMYIYSNGYRDVYPRAGGPGASWATRTPDWKATDRQEAYGLDPNGADDSLLVNARESLERAEAEAADQES